MGNEDDLMARRTFSLATAAWLTLGSMFLVTALVEEEALAPVFTGLLPWAPAAPQESTDEEAAVLADAPPAPVSLVDPPSAPEPIVVVGPDVSAPLSPVAPSVAPAPGSGPAPGAEGTAPPTALDEEDPPIAPPLPPLADVLAPEPEPEAPDGPADPIEVVLDADAEAGPLEAHADATVTATDPASAASELT